MSYVCHGTYYAYKQRKRRIYYRVTFSVEKLAKVYFTSLKLCYKGTCVVDTFLSFRYPKNIQQMSSASFGHFVGCQEILNAMASGYFLAISTLSKFLRFRLKLIKCITIINNFFYYHVYFRLKQFFFYKCYKLLKNYSLNMFNAVYIRWDVMKETYR